MDRDDERRGPPLRARRNRQHRGYRQPVARAIADPPCGCHRARLDPGPVREELLHLHRLAVEQVDVPRIAVRVCNDHPAVGAPLDQVDGVRQSGIDALLHRRELRVEPDGRRLVVGVLQPEQLAIPIVEDEIGVASAHVALGMRNDRPAPVAGIQLVFVDRGAIAIPA
jgi:hypothetical protein